MTAATPEPTREQHLTLLRHANEVARAAMQAGHHPFGALLVAADHQTVLMEQRNVDSVNPAILNLKLTRWPEAGRRGHRA